MFYVLISISQVDEELEALLENGEGLSDEKQVISLCRLMVRVETMEQRLTCLKLIQVTKILTGCDTYKLMMMMMMISNCLISF